MGFRNYSFGRLLNPCNEASTAFEFSTKDFNLGAPDVRKKLYKIYVSYKNPVETMPRFMDELLGSPSLYIALNGRTTPNLEDVGESYGQHWVRIGAFEPTSLADGWVRGEFNLSNDPSIPWNDYNNVYTVSLKIARSSYPYTDPKNGLGVLTNPGFEINDMSVIYRAKPLK